jgi:formamidopyrimidine-DNA glycosylase
MPELPEVETVCRGLATQLVGARVRDVHVVRRDLRQAVPADFEARLRGQQLVAVQRRAKYILCCFADQTMIVAHLGMTGRFTVRSLPLPALSAHDHVILYTEDGRAAIYSDPRRFGLLVLGRSDRQAAHPLLKELGPEPLGDEFSAASLLAKVAGRRSPLKTLLLDQTVVAGLGNIYVSEALWRAANSARPHPAAGGSDTAYAGDPRGPARRDRGWGIDAARLRAGRWLGGRVSEPLCGL